MGLGLSKLTFDLQRKDLPLVVLTLAKLDRPEHTKDYDIFESARDRQFGTSEFAVLFRGQSLATSGVVTNEWDRISLTTFARTDDFIKNSTDPAYPQQSSYMPEQSLIEYVQFIGHAKVAHAYRDPIVVLLAELKELEPGVFIELLKNSLGDYAAQVEFEIPVDNITKDSTRSANFLVLVGFSNANDMVKWVNNTIRKSQFSLLSRQMGEVSIVIATPNGIN